jgi:lauroyl/myristoyl acyltransferase
LPSRCTRPTIVACEETSSHRQRWPDVYEIFRWAAKIVPKLPRGLRQSFAIVIGTLGWLLARRQRERVTANVIQVLGGSIPRSQFGVTQTQRIVRRVFCNCIRNYLDLLALPAVTRQEIVAHLDVRGVENLEAALALGRGAVLFSAHLGPFEYLPAWFSARGYQMVVPVENSRDQRLLHLMVDLRRRSGADFVPLNGPKAIRMLYDALSNNQLVLITADRAVAGESVVTDFFGAPARLPQGPVDLSLRTGAPLVGAFGWRSAGDRMAAEFTPLTLALPADQRDKREVLQAELIRQLERTVRAHLDEWVVFAPVWVDHN